jgi:hypothetical protein
MQFLAHAACHVRVQIAEGFVQQEDHGMLDKRASQRDALLLAAGQFVGVSPVKPFKADEAEHLLYAGFSFAAWEVSKAESNIVLDT